MVFFLQIFVGAVLGWSRIPIHARSVRSLFLYATVVSKESGLDDA